MTITELETILSDTEKNIAEVREMLNDYNTCKSSKAKAVILGAAVKITTTVIKPNMVLEKKIEG